VHVKRHSRNFCRHKLIFVFSQTVTNPASNHCCQPVIPLSYAMPTT